MAERRKFEQAPVEARKRRKVKVIIGDEKEDSKSYTYAESLPDETNASDDKLRIKINHDNEIRIVSVAPNVSFQDLTKMLRKKYNKDVEILQYEDDDGDVIPMRSDSDLVEALERYKQLKANNGGASPSALSRKSLMVFLNKSEVGSDSDGSPRIPSRKQTPNITNNIVPPSLGTANSITNYMNNLKMNTTQGKENNPPPLRASPVKIIPDIANNITKTEENNTPKHENMSVTPNAVFKWRKGDMLGSGSYAAVYMGLNLDTGELMAVKQVALGRGTDNEKNELEALQQEISLFEKLQHANIVRYYGSQLDHQQSTLNIFLEYVPGGSITKLIKKFGALGENIVSNYTKQVLQGLEYLHECNIIHRDIKGGNLLVTQTGQVKLADFGCSRYIEKAQNGAVTSFKGTINYMAPEVVRQEGYGKKADIWSLGCTLLEMLTGLPPFADLDAACAVYLIGSSTEPPPFPTTVSPDCRDFLTLCLQRDPNLRPDANALLRHPFIVNASTQVVNV